MELKKQTGKTPLEHAIAYAEEKILRKKKDPAFLLLKKLFSSLFNFKKQLNLTKSKIINEKKNESLKGLTSSLQTNINKNSKIKYLD